MSVILKRNKKMNFSKLPSFSNVNFPAKVERGGPGKLSQPEPREDVDKYLLVRYNLKAKLKVALELVDSDINGYITGQCLEMGDILGEAMQGLVGLVPRLREEGGDRWYDWTGPERRAAQEESMRLCEQRPLPRNLYPAAEDIDYYAPVLGRVSDLTLGYMPVCRDLRGVFSAEEVAHVPEVREPEARVPRRRRRVTGARIRIIKK